MLYECTFTHTTKARQKKKKWTKTELNATELHWIELMLCSLYVWDAVGWSMQVNIRSRRDLIVCRLFRHFWYVPSTKILAHFVAFVQWKAATTTTGSIENEPFSRDNCIFSWNKLWEKKNVFDFDGKKRRAFGEFKLNKIQWKYPFAITFIYYGS